MAHFAQLQNNIVVRTVVISNDDIIDGDGNENENMGVAICEQIAGPGVWKQTSYNNKFRKMFALPGFIYVPEDDLFYNPQSPHPSWVLDNNYDWRAPVPYPEDGGNYMWNEQTLDWIEAHN